MTTLLMKNLSRVNYLKHYLGGHCLVTDPSNFGTGEIEDVDIEDQSCLIKRGEKSFWVEAQYVSPALKSFKDLDQETIDNLLANMVIGNIPAVPKDFRFHTRSESMIEWINESNGFFLELREDWAIYIRPMNGGTYVPSNYPRLIFLLCELGYDVCQVFND